MKDYFTISALQYNYLMLVLAFLFDGILLAILWLEFKPHWMNIKILNGICLISLIIGFIFPFLREILFFLSMNTIVIMLTYKIMKSYYIQWLFPKYWILTGAYIYIIKLMFYPLYMFILYTFFTS
jgi:hypothetical protein